jgi:putative ABC transport system ATP-binding protein
MPTIEIKDIIRVYKTGKSEVIALRGLHLNAKAGEIVAIKGPSGCGKTTLLNLIGGLDRPTAGSISIDGENIIDYDDATLVRYRRDRIGFIFQFFNLVPTLTAEENIELPLQLAGKPRSFRKERVRELLELVGLSDRASHKPDELSGGEQQRIAIAVALANDPDIILADEPTGELDTQTGREVLDIFRDLNIKLGKTQIIVTHDKRVAEIAHRILRIEDGLIVEEEKGEGKLNEISGVEGDQTIESPIPVDESTHTTEEEKPSSEE